MINLKDFRALMAERRGSCDDLGPLLRTVAVRLAIQHYLGER